AIAEATEKLSNWGRWGKDDQIGTLNNITPDDIVNAAALIRKGRSFGLGIPLDTKIQTGLFGGRWNPIHTFLATGTDAFSGNQDAGGLEYADDAINMPIQGSTHWDSLNHIYYDKKMYNGYDCRLVDSKRAAKNGIENTREKMVGRGVLLDVARFKDVEYLEDGYGISNAELDDCAAAQGVEIHKGDFVIIRTGQQEKCLKSGNWAGYAGGDAPGVKFEN
ncbi:cyclase family protein, partial [Acidithiobacillus ferriphilus]